MSPDDLIKVIEKDRTFFEQSGGGVTFSGGEPLMQSEFLLKMLKLCKERSFHTVVDTSGHGDTGELLKISEFTDLFLFDLKLANPDEHRQWTGVETDLIHSNLRKLCERGAHITFRIPMIHGVNCDKANIKKTAELITSLPGNNHHIDLLPWHNIAIKKYEQLNKAYAHAESFEAPTPQELSAAVMIFAKHGITANVL
jgi:pyruvate formate lyase activating enzyme